MFQFRVLLLFFLIASVLSVNEQGEELLSWKSSLNGRPADVFKDWNENDENPCSWTGVKCNTYQQVSEFNLSNVDLYGYVPNKLTSLSISLSKLVLSGTHLIGSIPKEIGLLRELNLLDLSDNSLTNEIPIEVCNLFKLDGLLLNSNGLNGSIPDCIGSLSNLKSLVFDENQLSGGIPTSIGDLKKLQIFKAGGNRNLEGSLPSEIGSCSELVFLGLSETSLSGFLPSSLGQLKQLDTLSIHTSRLSGQIPSEISDCSQLVNLYLFENSLSGSIPARLGNLRNLQNLLLWKNKLSGILPPELGSCSEMLIIDVSQNLLTGSIPSSFGNLGHLVELKLSSNQLSGQLPLQLSNCQSLTHIVLDNNQLTGNLLTDIGVLLNLSVLYLGNNKFEGHIPVSLGLCKNLLVIDLSRNSLTGPIPSEVGSCSKLQLLDLSKNELSGEIPVTLGKIPSLDNGLKLDISYNQLTGNLQVFSDLQFVVLNVSFNNLSGLVPDTRFFRELPLSNLLGNPFLCLSRHHCFSDTGNDLSKHGATARVLIAVILCGVAILLIALLLIVAYIVKRDIGDRDDGDGDNDVEVGPPWELTMYQNLNFSISDVVKNLTAGNIIGQGSSGTVYKANMPLGLIVAVKKFRNSDKQSLSAFSSEIATLAKIRHTNIVRLLGSGANRRSSLSIYDYYPNGTLGQLLHNHERTVEWETRFKIALGLAKGLSYLHHDCVPPIMHRDVKSHNILLGDCYEVVLADFGVARTVEDENGSLSANLQFTGSYGYLSPEYGNLSKITEKSDVYSYGVVLLEIITGKKPVDPAFSEDQNIEQWVREHVRNKSELAEVLDPKLQGQPDKEVEEMLRAIEISLMCTSSRAKDRPPMQYVVLLLTEIRQEQTEIF